jgi:hypothetical protein
MYWGRVSRWLQGSLAGWIPSADGKRIDIYQGSGNIALQPNILVTVKHAFQDLDTGQILPIDKCRFHNWKHPNDEIAIVIDDPAQLPPTGTSKTPELKRRDLTAVRLAQPVEGCQPLAIPEKGAMLQEGDRVFEATAKQDGMLGQWSGREPVSEIGTIRYVLPPGPDGPLAYFTHRCSVTNLSRCWNGHQSRVGVPLHVRAPNFQGDGPARPCAASWDLIRGVAHRHQYRQAGELIS